MKFLINTGIRIRVFFHYLPLLFRGELAPGRFFTLLGRLNLFLSKLQHNKFQRVAGGIRLDLYVPSFPGPAFFQACDKFRVFQGKLPSTGALLSVTNACVFACEHCYQRLDKGGDVDINLLIDCARYLQDHGVAFFNIEGGEPFLRFERLKTLCAAIDQRSEIWVNSTGYGMTEEKLREINPTAIMFSLHSPDPAAFNRFMGRDFAWDTLLEGIRVCKACGVPFAFNACLMEEAFSDGSFERMMDRARELGACLVQLIKPKPAGGWLSQGKPLFSEEGLERAKDLVNRYNLDRSYKAFPMVAAQIMDELPDTFGCTAGGTDRFYVNAKGDVQPCEFLNISFGNIADEPFPQVYERMRSCFRRPGSCMLCERQAAPVHQLFQDHALDRLPLPPELSARIYTKWDLGEPTELYQKIDNP